MAKPTTQSVTNGEPMQVSCTAVRSREACSYSSQQDSSKKNATTSTTSTATTTTGVTMIPQAEAVLSSDHSADSYFTMHEDVDSLWDDVSALRRELKTMTEDMEEYKDQSDDTTNYIIRKQNAESKRTDESIEALTTDVSTLKIQMSILREKTIKNELMLKFLMQQADPVARRRFEATVAPIVVDVGLSAQLDRVF
jgi:predicted RNase H-like nuclease (RuvC/YqgF family)